MWGFQVLSEEGCGINATSPSRTLDLDFIVAFRDPNFCPRPLGLFGFGVSLVLDPIINQCWFDVVLHVCMYVHPFMRYS